MKPLSIFTKTKTATAVALTVLCALTLPACEVEDLATATPLADHVQFARLPDSVTADSATIYSFRLEQQQNRGTRSLRNLRLTVENGLLGTGPTLENAATTQLFSLADSKTLYVRAGRSLAAPVQLTLDVVDVPNYRPLQASIPVRSNPGRSLFLTPASTTLATDTANFLQMKRGVAQTVTLAVANGAKPCSYGQAVSVAQVAGFGSVAALGILPDVLTGPVRVGTQFRAGAYVQMRPTQTGNFALQMLVHSAGSTPLRTETLYIHVEP